MSDQSRRIVERIMAATTTSVSFRGFVPAIVTVLRSGYTRSMLSKDLASGVTVGIVALPLAIAFAIGAGASPAQGLWTAIIGGFVISALGGSRYQVSGPTGAFVVIIAGVIAEHGMGGLVTATLLAGIMLVAMGLTGLGRLIKFIPYPVTTGFTTGIGLIIAGGQLKDFLGLAIPEYPAEFFARLASVARYAPTIDYYVLATGVATMALIIVIRKLAPRLPAAVIAIGVVSLAAFLLDLPVPTIGSKYGAIPKGLPTLAAPELGWATVRDVFPSALTIALLGAIESLLSAVVADGMKGDRHDSSVELVAQGVGNALCALFGGIPATGAIARTATNIKNGAQSPVSGMVHALVLLVFTVFLSGLASAIPLAALSAVLLVVAWDMSELRRFLSMRYAPKSDTIVMLVTFVLTVAIDLTVAVEVGFMLAVFLFIKRTAETSSLTPILDATEVDSSSCLVPASIPAGVELYEINGPFFFGTADYLQDALSQVSRAPEVFILRMRNVPAIDATGLNALEAFRRHCERHHTTLVLSGVNEQPRKAFESTGLAARIGKENILPAIDLAIARARELLHVSRETK